MSQAVAIYILFAGDVLLICWFGTQLTQHVRDNYLFYSKVFAYIMRKGLKKYRNLTRTGVSFFLYYLAFYTDFFFQNLETRLKVS